jgi:hypothetical protein
MTGNAAIWPAKGPPIIPIDQVDRLRMPVTRRGERCGQLIIPIDQFRRQAGWRTARRARCRLRPADLIIPVDQRAGTEPRDPPEISRLGPDRRN